jgi:hypothetical protein
MTPRSKEEYRNRYTTSERRRQSRIVFHERITPDHDQQLRDIPRFG